MPLTVDEQMRVLTRIWGGDREGYVFLPWITGTAKDTKQRRANYHEGPGFEWPKDRERIKKHIASHTGDELYFTPCLFEDSKRLENYAAPERALWADLDEADPRRIDTELKPTITWESSPGRYQAVWLLDRLLTGASWASKENHRLTAYLGADPSGWDTTQLLRVPGVLNYKPEYKNDNGGEPVQGELLWLDGPRYSPEDFADLPEVISAGSAEDELLDEELLSGVDRHEVWARVRLKLSPLVREYMSRKDVPEKGDGGEGGRDGVLWQIERDLADAGCSLAEIVAIVRASVWNKYKGRNDELRRLKVEAGKAIAISKQEDTLEQAVERQMRPAPSSFATLLLSPRQRTSWLVKSVWSKGGVGFIAGSPKSYKSWTALDLAFSVATGQPFLNDFPVLQPGPVLYVQEEDSESMVVEHGETILMGKSPLRHPAGYLKLTSARSMIWVPSEASIPLSMYVRKGFRISDPAWQAWLDETLTNTPYSLMVIDTLGTTAGEVDIDKASEMNSKVLAPLKTLAGKHSIAVAVVHHNRKESTSNGNNRAGQNMLGSTAIHAWVEDALYMRSKEVDEHTQISRVWVERESKSESDLRFVIEVPRMVASDGVWWAPRVTPWTHTEDEDNRGSQRKTPTPKERPSRLLVKVQELGPIVTVQRYSDVHDVTERTARTVIGKAVDAGLLVPDGPERWRRVGKDEQ